MPQFPRGASARPVPNPEEPRKTMNYLLQPQVIDALIVAGPILALLIYGFCTGKLPPPPDEK